MPKVIEESRFKGQDEWTLENTWDVKDYADSLRVLKEELFAQADVKMATTVTAAVQGGGGGWPGTIEYPDGELTWRYTWVEDVVVPVPVKPTSMAPRMTVQVDWYRDEEDLLRTDPYLVVGTSVTVAVVTSGERGAVIQVTGPLDELVEWVLNVYHTGEWTATLDTVKTFVPVP